MVIPTYGEVESNNYNESGEVANPSYLSIANPISASEAIASLILRGSEAQRQRQREAERINNTNPETGERETERMFVNTNPVRQR